MIDSTETTILNAPPPAISLIPTAYVMHIVTSVCSHCGTRTNRSDFYAQTHIRSRFNTGIVKQLTRCDAPLYNVPVTRTNVGTRQVPYCSDCTTIDLSHLPPPPQASQLYDLAGPALKDRPKAPPHRTTPADRTPRKATLGDLA